MEQTDGRDSGIKINCMSNYCPGELDVEMDKDRRLEEEGTEGSVTKPGLPGGRVAIGRDGRCRVGRRQIWVPGSVQYTGSVRLHRQYRTG